MRWCGEVSLATPRFGGPTTRTGLSGAPARYPLVVVLRVVPVAAHLFGEAALVVDLTGDPVQAPLGRAQVAGRGVIAAERRREHRPGAAPVVAVGRVTTGAAVQVQLRRDPAYRLDKGGVVRGDDPERPAQPQQGTVDLPIVVGLGEVAQTPCLFDEGGMDRLGPLGEGPIPQHGRGGDQPGVGTRQRCRVHRAARLLPDVVAG